MKQSLTVIRGIKDQVRNRDGKCVDCGISPIQYKMTTDILLDVHRLNPGSIYSLEDTVTVCRACHRQRHKKSNGRTTTKVFFDPPPDLKLAIKLAAIREGISTSKLVREIVTKRLSEAIAKARKIIADRKDKKKPPKA